MSVSTQFHGNGGSNVNRYQAGGLSAGLGGNGFQFKGSNPTNPQSMTPTKNYTSYEAAATSYVVKSGDSLSAIAKRYGIKVEDLYEDNKDLIGNNPNNIYPGQELLIRGQEEQTYSAESIQYSAGPTLPPEEPFANISEENPVPLSMPVTPISNSAGSGTEVKIPDSVRQTGLCPNYTSYTRFYDKWNKGTMQREIANQWGAAGKTSSNGIATLNDRYLVAVSSKFGNVGDNIDIVLNDGQVINATIADMKGGDATSEWGHVLTKSGAVDIIEWEATGSQSEIDLGTWRNVGVDKIVNLTKNI